MSRKNKRILNISERTRLAPVLSLLKIKHKCSWKEVEVALYETFCEVPLERNANPFDVEDRTLLLRTLVESTFTYEYREEAKKELVILKEILGDLQTKFYWINTLLTKEVKL